MIKGYKIGGKTYSPDEVEVVKTPYAPLTDQETDSRGDLYIDAGTMKKVDDALQRAGLTGVWTRTAVVTELQSAGILFRERGKF